MLFGVSSLDDAWRALLLQTTKQFCGKKLDKIFTIFQFEDEDRALLSRKWDKKVELTQRSALGRKHLILVDYLLVTPDVNFLH